MIEEAHRSLCMPSGGHSSISLTASYLYTFIMFDRNNKAENEDAHSFYCFLRILKLFKIPSAYKLHRDEDNRPFVTTKKEEEKLNLLTHYQYLTKRSLLCHSLLLLWNKNKKFETNSMECFRLFLWKEKKLKTCN